MNPTADVTWPTPDGTFKYRVAALVTRHDQLLLCHVTGVDHSFLPGGKPRLGESSRDALARELVEELGRPLTVGPLALIVENLYNDEQGDFCHELGFYCRVPWPDESSGHTARAVEEGHSFAWAPVDALDDTNFQPADLAPVFKDLGAAPRHIILDRRAPQE